MGSSGTRNDWHILLPDIRMKLMDGVAPAKQIRVKNAETQIIFVTGCMDYIADGYDVGRGITCLSM